MSEVAAAETHLDEENVDGTAELEVVDSALVSPPLELEGKEAEEKGTEPEPEPDPEPELDSWGISETVAAYTAEEEATQEGGVDDPNSDGPEDNTNTELPPVEGEPLLDRWEELIDEASRLSYYFHDTENVTTWERPLAVAVSHAPVVGTTTTPGPHRA